MWFITQIDIVTTKIIFRGNWHFFGKSGGGRRWRRPAERKSNEYIKKYLNEVIYFNGDIASFIVLDSHILSNATWSM